MPTIVKYIDREGKVLKQVRITVWDYNRDLVPALLGPMGTVRIIVDIAA